MQITAKRLVLREFGADDWRAMLDYQRDPLYLRYYPWEDRDETAVRDFVDLFRDWQSERPRRRFQLAIVHQENGQLIGNCGLRRKPENEWEADLGYELSPRYWGHGYATEAARAMVDFGFREVGLQRVSSWCIADNLASARVLERLGFRREGRLRRNEYFKGRWWDTLLYALLAEDWQSVSEPAGS